VPAEPGWHNGRIVAGQAHTRTTGARRQELSRRQARVVGLGGFLVAAALPPFLWHRAIAAVAEDFRLDLEYLSGWTGYALIAAGLAFCVPVVLSIGRMPGSRLYPRSRNAYTAWGVSLYLLGFAIAVQVAAVTRTAQVVP
jgi:hypothetical protein